MTVDFKEPFNAKVEVEDSKEYPGLMQVTVCVGWHEVCRWLGDDLSEGVAVGVSSLIKMREIHNIERQKIKDAAKAARIADAENPVCEVDDEDPSTGQATDPELEPPPLDAGMVRV